MTNQVILARRMNLNPNDSVKWSLMKLPTVKDSSTGRLFLAIIPHICRLICTTQNSTWGIFTDVLHKKVYILMSNHSLLSGSPVFTCAVLELGQASCPSPHQPFRHIRSMNWQLSKLFELDSNITQISTHFLKYYTNIYTLSPGFDGLQEGLQCFKKISRKLK